MGGKLISPIGSYTNIVLFNLVKKIPNSNFPTTTFKLSFMWENIKKMNNSSLKPMISHLNQWNEG